MFSLILLGIIASACAAPRVDTVPHLKKSEDYIRARRDVNFSYTAAGIPKLTDTDNEYKITMALNGYQENQIVVKARDDEVIIEVTGEHFRNHRYTGTLPNNVNLAGTWFLKNGYLTIVFPKRNVGSNAAESESNGTAGLPTGHHAVVVQQ